MKKVSTVFVLLFLTGCLVTNGQKVCSTFCNALGTRTSPGKSCSEIYQVNKASRGVSKHYWIQTDDGPAEQVYCDMELECGGHKGGWTRIAQLDTTDGDSCPGEWNNSVIYNSLCTGGDTAGCYSANFSVPYNYNKICGQVRGFQKGTTSSFYPYIYSNGATPPNSNFYIPDEHSTTVNGVYVNGISITLGDPRKHIWTYAAGLSDKVTFAYDNCPCVRYSRLQAPAFVGNNYYCESGTNSHVTNTSVLYREDALWDGEQCPRDVNSCCDRTGQPWFLHQLPMNEYQHLEVRICQDKPFSSSAILVEKLQLFIQ